MTTVTRTIRIAAPPDLVWQFLGDVSQQMRWMRDMRQLRVDTPGPLRVGWRGSARVRMFGVAVDDPVEMVAFEERRRLAFVHLGLWRGDGQIRLQAINGGAATLVWWRERLRFEPDALALPRPIRLLARPMRALDVLAWPVFAYVFRADLRRLRVLAQREHAGRAG
jgi:uncharacterized protein YndB with AHSA1/START domain